jgi:2,4-diketo-3-deoxy-L-fuconate hydrolase
MKIFRFGNRGAERPGIFDSNGIARDASSAVHDWSGFELSPRKLRKLARIDLSSLPRVPDGQRLGSCVGGTRNFIAVGLNYADHAREARCNVPSEPVIFNKAPSCIVGPNDPIVVPRNSSKLDWEVELAAVIGEEAVYASAADSRQIIAGYCICHDVSERSFQLERAGQWMKGKGCPTFGPLGPWLVTPDEVGDVQKLELWLDVNGVRMQSGTTASMIFSVEFLVSYISQFMQLEPGDVITTGTPAGVGLARNPAQYLAPGDVISLGITGLGEQRQVILPCRVDDWQAGQLP